MDDPVLSGILTPPVFQIMKSSTRLLCCSALCCLSLTAHGALTSVYQFDETSGTSAADAIRGAGGTGNVNGGSTWTAGKIGNAIEFNGSSGFVLAPNAVPTGTMDLTISAWVWADAANTWGTIVKNWGNSSPGAFHFGFDNTSGRISNYLNAPTDGPLIAPTVLSLNTWHHVAFTYSGGSATQTLYIDGVQVAQRLTAPADLDALGPNMSIGVKTDNTTLAADANAPGYWDGRIDDLAIWNEVLSPAQIAQIKANGDLGIGVVPEPGAVALCVLASAGLMRRRR